MQYSADDAQNIRHCEIFSNRNRASSYPICPSSSCSTRCTIAPVYLNLRQDLRPSICRTCHCSLHMTKVHFFGGGGGFASLSYGRMAMALIELKPVLNLQPYWAAARDGEKNKLPGRYRMTEWKQELPNSSNNMNNKCLILQPNSTAKSAH